MAGKIIQISRNFSSSSRLLSSLAEPLKADAGANHAAETANLWKKIFFFVCIPAMVVSVISVSLEEKPKRPEFVKYSYLRIRNKPFPWRDGVKSLFHNPHTNALPDGYETEEEHH